MIPTKTLRERMRAALEKSRASDPRVTDLEALVEAAIQAIGDPCIIKTADTLEPTFTLRAQDLTADELIENWCVKNPQAAQAKREEAYRCAEAMRVWSPRKRPD